MSVQLKYLDSQRVLNPGKVAMLCRRSLENPIEKIYFFKFNALVFYAF